MQLVTTVLDTEDLDILRNSVQFQLLFSWQDFNFYSILFFNLFGI